MEDVSVLLITGPVGVGKTSTAFEARELHRHERIPHAVVDLDSLTWNCRLPADDPFNYRLAFRNLTAVWANCAASGVARRVVETRDELAPYRQAIPCANLTVVRLRASNETLYARIASRNMGSSEWPRRRAAELAQLMDVHAVEDHLVDTDGRHVADLACEVPHRAGVAGATCLSRSDLGMTDWLDRCGHRNVIGEGDRTEMTADGYADLPRARAAGRVTIA